MERKPQQQTLSIRISDSLREFLERSKKVFSVESEDALSTSDVAKILLESAKKEGFEHRFAVSQLGQAPTEALVAIRKKWESGQPRSRAEWIFMAEYIQIACEELTGDSHAPSAESYAVLLDALLAVRGLRTNRGAELDRYYLGNLVNTGTWNDRKLEGNLVPDSVGQLAKEVRSSGTGKKAAGAGRCFYAAVRDEEFQEVSALNDLLAPQMETLFRMAARGHWIREQKPVRLLRDGSLMLGVVPRIKHQGMWLACQPTPTDISFSVGIDSADLIYIVSGYAQIREFNAMLNRLTPGNIWSGVNFHGFANEATSKEAESYQFRRNQDGVTLGFSQENWGKLQKLFAAAMAEPKLQNIYAELSMIYGDL